MDQKDRVLCLEPTPAQQASFDGPVSIVSIELDLAHPFFTPVRFIVPNGVGSRVEVG